MVENLSHFQRLSSEDSRAPSPVSGLCQTFPAGFPDGNPVEEQLSEEEKGEVWSVYARGPVGHLGGIFFPTACDSFKNSLSTCVLSTLRVAMAMSSATRASRALLGISRARARVAVGGALSPSPLLLAPSVISGSRPTHDPLLVQRLLGKLGSSVPPRKYVGERTNVRHEKGWNLGAFPY